MQLEDLVKEFLFDCEIRNLSKDTIHNYERQLSLFLRFLSEGHGVTTLDDFKTPHIKQFVAMLKQKRYKESYINNLLKAIKRFCSYLFDEGYTENIISEKVKNVKEPRVLIHTFSDDEIYRMIHYYAGDTYLDIRNRLILMILFDTGIRASELMDMRPEQVREDFFQIYGKGRKERVVNKSPHVSKQLVKYNVAKTLFFQYRDTEDYLILSKNGKKLSEGALIKLMVKAAEHTGVNPMVRVSPHTCRHTFAHSMLKNGLDLYSLSRLLGHESVSITQVYLNSIKDAQVLQSAKKTGVLAHLYK